MSARQKHIPSERCGVSEAVAIIGGSVRTCQDMAVAGDLPSAAKVRGRWSFNVAALRQFVREREKAACQNAKPRPDAHGVTASSGRELRSVAAQSDGHYARAMRLLLRGGEKRASTNS